MVALYPRQGRDKTYPYSEKSYLHSATPETFIVLDTSGTVEASAELAEAYCQSGDADKRHEPETVANLQFDAMCRRSFA